MNHPRHLGGINQAIRAEIILKTRIWMSVIRGKAVMGWEGVIGVRSPDRSTPVPGQP
jgi:hypothetical protein